MNTPTPTPDIYCPDLDTVVITSDDPTHQNIVGTYTVEHKSSVGVKYVNADKTIKITYSSKINNIVNGHWRWSLNSSPYTLLYANPSNIACMPRQGWVNINEQTFTGNFSGDGFQDEFDVYQPCVDEFDVYQPCLVYDVYKKCSPYELDNYFGGIENYKKPLHGDV